MSQNSLVVGNLGAPAFRSALNNALNTLATQNSGTSEPSTTYANMIWYDTTNDLLKMRNEADSAWITLGKLDQTAGEFVPSLNGIAHAAGKLFYSDGTDFAGLSIGSEGQVLTVNASGLPEWATTDVSEDGPNTTSGASAYEFTGIPSGITEMDVFLDGVSSAGAGLFLLQLGYSAGYVTSGYKSHTTNRIATGSSTNAFVIYNHGATYAHSIECNFRKLPGAHRWVMTGFGRRDDAATYIDCYSSPITLPGELTRIALGNVGSSNFDGGEWSVRYRK